jgi:hypothetical protein
MSASVQPRHPTTLASVLPLVIRTAMCWPVIGPCQRSYSATCQFFIGPHQPLKMPKMSDTCHLLVLPRVPIDVIMMSC